jgi:hypothetical protein
MPSPFALSLSKGQAEPVEALVPHAKGFDKLSPNGDNTRLRYLSPNGFVARLHSIRQGDRNGYLSPNGSSQTSRFASRVDPDRSCCFAL